MTEVGVQFSITNAPLHVVTKTTMGRRRKSPIIATPGNLFNHQQRSHQMQYSTVLPIISLSSVSDFKEKLIRMASSNKSIKQMATQSPTPTEFRLKLPSSDMLQTKTRIPLLNRSVTSNNSKSLHIYPAIVARPTTPYRPINPPPQQEPGARFLYVVNSPALPRPTTSVRIPNSSLNPLPLHLQPHLLTTPLVPRPHPPYGHFLAYLRRQSLARMRRKQEQQQEEGNTDPIDSTVTFNSSRSILPLFHSTSNLSLSTLTPETSSMPTINLQSKRKPRPLSSYRLLPRAASSLQTNYRLNLNYTPPLKPPPPLSPSPRSFIKKSSDDQSWLLTHTSVLITPTNSIVDEAILSPTKKAPYELELSGNMLNYCYVSDSGVTYQGQLLATPV